MTKQVLLDTNFIMTCIKQKIDFFEELPMRGLHIIIPEEVIAELVKLKQNSAIKLLDTEKDNFKQISLTGKNVDNAIINYARLHKSLIIATLDRGIRIKIKNKKINIKNRKTLEIV